VTFRERMQNVLNALAAILTLVAGVYIVIVVAAVIDWGFVKSEITNYPLQCRESVRAGACENIEYGLRKITYKVMPDRQEVMHWVQGFPVERLTKCAVRDRKNWSCTFNDGSAEFGFNGGAYWERTITPGALSAWIEKEVHVSRWQWLNQGCKDSGMSSFVCYPVIAFLE